ncbi:MAG: hypothetical protein OXH03_04285 [Bacteroidetes bacterium]|nr:hypothetical protein [Bacteroidota bacterium]MDE2673269.1 hypothetical protein [Bacteroidota bacterium]
MQENCDSREPLVIRLSFRPYRIFLAAQSRLAWEGESVDGAHVERMVAQPEDVMAEQETRPHENSN